MILQKTTWSIAGAAIGFRRSKVVSLAYTAYTRHGKDRSTSFCLYDFGYSLMQRHRSDSRSFTNSFIESTGI